MIFFLFILTEIELLKAKNNDEAKKSFEVVFNDFKDVDFYDKIY